MKKLFAILALVLCVSTASASHNVFAVRARVVVPHVPVVQVQAIYAQPVVQAVVADHCVQQVVQPVVQHVHVAPVVQQVHHVQAFRQVQHVQAFANVGHVQQVVVQQNRARFPIVRSIVGGILDRFTQPRAVVVRQRIVVR